MAVFVSGEGGGQFRAEEGRTLHHVCQPLPDRWIVFEKDECGRWCEDHFRFPDGFLLSVEARRLFFDDLPWEVFTFDDIDPVLAVRSRIVVEDDGSCGNWTQVYDRKTGEVSQLGSWCAPLTFLSERTFDPREELIDHLEQTRLAAVDAAETARFLSEDYPLFTVEQQLDHWIDEICGNGRIWSIAPCEHLDAKFFEQLELCSGDRSSRIAAALARSFWIDRTTALKLLSLPRDDDAWISIIDELLGVDLRRRFIEREYRAYTVNEEVDFWCERIAEEQRRRDLHPYYQLHSVFLAQLDEEGASIEPIVGGIAKFFSLDDTAVTRLLSLDQASSEWEALANFLVSDD